MNKTELIVKLSEKTGLPKNDVDVAISNALDIIEDELISGGNVNISGFGTFKPSIVHSRPCRNPRTGEPIVSTEHKTVRFSISKVFKDKVIVGK